MLRWIRVWDRDRILQHAERSSSLWLIAVATMGSVPLITAFCLKYVSVEDPAYIWDYRGYWSLLQKYGSLIYSGTEDWQQSVLGAIITIPGEMLLERVGFGSAFEKIGVYASANGATGFLFRRQRSISPAETTDRRATIPSSGRVMSINVDKKLQPLCDHVSARFEF
jgi:hypothetical protein